MRLNIPILEKIPSDATILVAGAGGGYDIFSGLPLFFELEDLGYDVHLANFSFSDIVGLYEGEQLTDTLVGVSIDVENHEDYFPEYYLAEWFFDERNEFITIWCFQKTGARPLIQNYRLLIRHLGIDCIILIDGGVDSLMRGNEPHAGTLLEDTLSIIAVNEMSHVPLRFLSCIGLGIEFEIGYAHLFENISALVKLSAFFGSCSLTQEMTTFQKYKEAVLYTFDQQPKYPSVICSSLISSVYGEYGDYHLTNRTKGTELRISSLMSMYWFFDLQAVAKQNYLIKDLKTSYTVHEAWNKMNDVKATLPNRPIPINPLP